MEAKIEQKSLKKENNVALGDISALLHATLFAYQKKLTDILGSGEAIFTHPIIETIKAINNDKGLNLLEGDTLEEIFENFSQNLIKAQVVNKAKFEKLSPNCYVFHIDECAYAKHVHYLLKPKDVTRPWALLAMSIFEMVKVKR